MKQWFLMQEQVRWRYVFKLLLMMFIKRAPLGRFKFLTFVALDSDGKPTSVPDVEPETSVKNGSMKLRHNVLLDVKNVVKKV